MKNTTIFSKTIMSSAALMIAALTFAGTVDVKPLVDKMPLQTAAEEKAVFCELIKGGKDTVLALCETILPPETGGDSKPRYAIGGLALYVTRPGAESERKMFSEAVLEAVQKAQDKEIKSFLLGLMRWCGSKESLPALASFLNDANLTEPATMALCSIRADGTADILIGALKNARGKQVITMIKALGEIQTKKAVSAIAKFATDEDKDLRRTALYALANIGDDGSGGSVLKLACQAKDPLERSIAGALYLQYARRQAEAGKKKQGAAVCRDVIAFSSEPGAEYLLPEALNTLAGITGDDAIPEIATALNSSNRVASVATMNTLIRMKNRKSIAELEKVLKEGPGHLRLALLNTLTIADSESLFDSIALNLKSEDQEIRTAAINVIAGKKGLPSLLKMLRSGSTENIPDLKRAILLSAGNKEMNDISAAMNDASAPVRVVLLDILGQRCATTQTETILASVTDPDQSVRLAAIKALGSTARSGHLEKMIGILMKATDTVERTAIARSIASTAKTITDPDQRTQLILSSLASAAPDQKEAIITILPDLGGKKALDVIIAVINGDDSKLKKTAIASLSNWPDSEAAASMLKTAATSTNLTQQVLLMRGYVRLIQNGKMNEETKIEMYKEALSLAKRPDEKKLILAAMADIRTVQSLLITGTYLDDVDIRDEAANLIVLIGCPGRDKYKGLNDPAIKPVLEKAAGIVKEKRLEKR